MNEEKTTLVYYAKLNERNESAAIWEHYNYLNEIVKGKGNSAGYETVYNAYITIEDKEIIMSDFNSDDGFNFTGLYEQYLKPSLTVLFKDISDIDFISMNETEFKTQLSSIQTVFIGMGDYYGKEFLDAVRTLMKLSEMTSEIDYQNRVNTALYEVEVLYRKIRNIITQEYSLNKARLTLALGNQMNASEINLELDKTDPELIKIYELLNKDSAVSGYDEEILWFRAEEIRLWSVYNKKQINE